MAVTRKIGHPRRLVIFDNPAAMLAAVKRLLAASERMCESLPLYSPSSAAYTRKEELDAAIKEMRGQNFFNEIE